MGGKKQKESATIMIALENKVDALQNQVTVLSSSMASIQKTMGEFNAAMNNIYKSSVSHTHRFALESLPGVNNEQVWVATMRAQGLNPDGTPLTKQPLQPQPVQRAKKPPDPSPKKKPSKKKKKKDDE